MMMNWHWQLQGNVIERASGQSLESTRLAEIVDVARLDACGNHLPKYATS